MSQILKKAFSVAVVVGLAFSLNATAQAQTARTPTATISAAGETMDVSDAFVDIGGAFFIPSQTFTFINGTVVTLSALGIPDPSLIYSFSVTNPFNAAVPFSFDAAIPVAPSINVGDSVVASVGYSLTDLTGNGVTLTPFPIAPYLSGFSQTVTGDGIDLGINEGTGFTGTGGGPAFTYTTSFANSGPSPIAFSTLDVHLSFTLTGLDAAGITGAVVVTPVPEPGAVALVAGMGISGVGFMLRRKRRIAPSA